MEIPPGSTVQIEAMELVLALIVSTLENQHPGTVQAAIQAIQRGNGRLGNVVSLRGEPLQTNPAVISYAVNLLKECEG